MLGQDGNDIVELGQGTDELNGGTGNDAVSALTHQVEPRAVVIDLTAGEAQSSTIGLDALAQFEHALGTDQDDTLIGNSANNILLGFGGADHLEGHDGDDRLDGADGIDFLDGGNGTDDCAGETVVNCED